MWDYVSGPPKGGMTRHGKDYCGKPMTCSGCGWGCAPPIAQTVDTTEQAVVVVAVGDTGALGEWLRILTVKKHMTK